MTLTNLQQETLDKITNKAKYGSYYEMATMSGKNIYIGLNGYAVAQLIKKGLITLEYKNGYINENNGYAYIPIKVVEK